MKTSFQGYYKKTDDEIKTIWDNGLIVFDTNVLLNLYRYSDTTRETLIDLISKFSDKIYLPHQAALEYNRNRYEVIAEQEKAYKDFLSKISQIQQDLQSTNKPPFLSSSIDSKLNEAFENVSMEVEDSIKKYCGFLKDDPIYNKLTALFKSKLGDEFNNVELEIIYEEGENRYVKKIPPGFEDEKTKDNFRKFGDLVLWKQIIKISKDLNKDIILITDERKTDWWWKLKDGRNMGPRQELVEEIYKESQKQFHMYSSERFLSYGQTYLKEQINKKALEEIQAMKSAELENLKYFDNKNYYHNEISNDQADSLHKRLIEIEKLIHSDDKITSFLSDRSISEKIEDRVNNYNNYILELRKERDSIKEKIDFINKHSYRNTYRDSYNSELDNEIFKKLIKIEKDKTNNNYGY
ncbi:PIN domain-containing protein [Chryseobacterium gwangjuense]|uniref:PIN domain-containing protein n=1 Tax=Chryseobacterium gwangjuense TaxID=1069980 RepID=UPI001E5ECB91|nr:PIN domain-containing protein [Chryseobacterium gwangjuense]MCE3074768.1 PIN domain-containing protein [Chryseobacterium gwangjuense]